MLFFFFKQKTAYEMRISDWSSDVCSSDLGTVRSGRLLLRRRGRRGGDRSCERYALRARRRHLYRRYRAWRGARRKDRKRYGLHQSGLLDGAASALRSEEHTSELQSLMRNSYAVC